MVHTYDGRLDYKGYLDFVVAVEHRKRRPCLAYLFRPLDLTTAGALPASSICTASPTDPLAPDPRPTPSRPHDPAGALSVFNVQYLTLTLTLTLPPTPWFCAGALSVFDVHYFAREIVAGLEDAGDEPPDLGTIVDEVFDLGKGRRPRRTSEVAREIAPRSRGASAVVAAGAGAEKTGALPTLTLAEICNSGAGSIIISMLMDVQGFWVRERGARPSPWAWERGPSP